MLILTGMRVHISVNTFNESHGFHSGLDAKTTGLHSVVEAERVRQ